MSSTTLRRLRRNSLIRDWVKETELHPKNIILPFFVVEGKGVQEPIKSMPGVYHLSIDNLIKDLRSAPQIHSVLLFGIPNKKDKSGSGAYKKEGITQKAIRALKKEFKDLIVISDVCLCGFTSNGHCGIIKNGRIDNDASIKALAKIALSHAEAGADFVAPSAMMDGQVKAIRQALNKKGFKDTGILAYSAKYASNFYGPFREALDSAPQFGDRKSYQMDFRNANEALREIEEDIKEGADIIMVKPALAYLDIIYRAKQKFNIPIAAYNVSGEYTMLQGLANSVGDGRDRPLQLFIEVLTSIKRAGADFIITYFGKEILRWIK